MKRYLKIGIIGDFNPARDTQTKLIEALELTANQMAVSMECQWLPTRSLEKQANVSRLSEYDGVWGSSGEYTSPEGAFRGIQYCRRNKLPYLGT